MDSQVVPSLRIRGIPPDFFELPVPIWGNRSAVAEDPADIRDEIRAFISEPDDRFADLALRLLAHQFACNSPFRAYCESIGAAPATVEKLEQIPAVPADAFKTGLPLSCFPPDAAAHVFLTSGTTSEVRGTHLLEELDTYALSVRNGWCDAGLPGGARAFLARPPPVHPGIIPCGHVRDPRGRIAEWLMASR